MINALVGVILKFFVWVANLIIGLISLPIAGLLNFLIPDVTSYSSQAINFLSTYIFDGLRFAKEIILNVTHFPRPLFGIAVGYITGLYGYFLATSAFRAVINVWKFLKGGKTGA